MPYNRKAIAPWSTEREQGIESATVDSNIETPQYLQPIVDTGVINKDGNWIGNTTSDRVFFDFQKDEAIANGAEILSNKVVKMYGYNKLNIGLKVSRAGDYNFLLLFGGDADNNYLNLNPINTSGQPKATIRTDSSTNAFSTLLNDAETIGADVWNIFQVNDMDGFNIKLKIINNSGGNADIETAIQRLV